MPVFPLQAKNDRWVTLLQISDLHFVDWPMADLEGQLERLEEAIRNCLFQPDEAYDLLLVTGDLVDGKEVKAKHHRRVLEKAKEYLVGLCSRLQLDPGEGALRVIPGNHDCRWHGILDRTAFSHDFQNVFRNVGGHDVTKHAIYPNLHLIVGCFNSNAVNKWAQLATGAVDMRDLAALENELDAIGATEAFVKVGLVHHHPLPIAEEEERPLRSALERFVGRFGSVPEFLILRNSGNFLERLLSERFRLLLHGHLHYPKTWQITKSVDGRERTLQVLACGSSGVVDREGFRSFNLVRIHNDGWIECVNHAVGDVGEQRARAMPTASYGTTRVIEWVAAPVSLHSEKLEIKCQVEYPTGDLLVHENIWGIRSATAAPVHEVPFLASSQALQRVQFKIRDENSHRRVDLIHIREEGGVQHLLRFTPPLQNGRHADAIDWHDITIDRRMYDALYHSQEDKRYMGNLEEPEIDKYELTMKNWYEQATVILNFPSEANEFSDFQLRVYSRGDGEDTETPGNDRRRERRFYREESRKHMTHFPSTNGHQIILHIDHPRVGYTYQLRWMLPASAIRTRKLASQIAKLRKTLYDNSGKPDANSHLATFLDNVRSDFRDMLEIDDDGDGPRGYAFAAYLFAFNNANGRLCCVARSLHAPNCFTNEVSYGNGIVGNAFRRAGPSFFERGQYEAAKRIGLIALKEEPPEDVKTLFAIPINYPKSSGWPVAVVAVAEVAGSGRLMLAGEPESDFPKKATTRIMKLWLDRAPDLWRLLAGGRRRFA